MKKQGAMELSVGTIVVIVLSMSMLILGLVLIRGLFSGATDATDIANKQIIDQIQKKFGEDKKLGMFPTTREFEVNPGDPAAFGFAIKNLIQGTADKSFSYEVVVSDIGNCGISEEVALGWISLGSSESNIPIASGESYVGRVTLNVPEGSPLCDLRYRVNVMYDTQAYAADLMDVFIRA